MDMSREECSLSLFQITIDYLNLARSDWALIFPPPVVEVCPVTIANTGMVDDFTCSANIRWYLSIGTYSQCIYWYLTVLISI